MIFPLVVLIMEKLNPNPVFRSDLLIKTVFISFLIVQVMCFLNFFLLYTKLLNWQTHEIKGIHSGCHHVLEYGF